MVVRILKNNARTAGLVQQPHHFEFVSDCKSWRAMEELVTHASSSMLAYQRSMVSWKNIHVSVHHIVFKVWSWIKVGKLAEGQVGVSSRFRLCRSPSKCKMIHYHKLVHIRKSLFELPPPVWEHPWVTKKQPGMAHGRFTSTNVWTPSLPNSASMANGWRKSSGSACEGHSQLLWVCVFEPRMQLHGGERCLWPRCQIAFHAQHSFKVNEGGICTLLNVRKKMNQILDKAGSLLGVGRMVSYGFMLESNKRVHGLSRCATNNQFCKWESLVFPCSSCLRCIERNKAAWCFWICTDHFFSLVELVWEWEFPRRNNAVLCPVFDGLGKLVRRVQVGGGIEDIRNSMTTAVQTFENAKDHLFGLPSHWLWGGNAVELEDKTL